MERELRGKILHLGGQAKDGIITCKWIKGCHEDLEEEPYSK